MCIDLCDSKKCFQRLSEKRHNLRSNKSRLSQVRDALWPSWGHKAETRAKERDVFELLVAVEQLQNYAEKDLNKKLHDHGMANVKGERRCLMSDHHHCHAECIEKGDK